MGGEGGPRLRLPLCSVLKAMEAGESPSSSEEEEDAGEEVALEPDVEQVSGKNPTTSSRASTRSPASALGSPPGPSSGTSLRLLTADSCL